MIPFLWIMEALECSAAICAAAQLLAFWVGEGSGSMGNLKKEADVDNFPFCQQAKRSIVYIKILPQILG